MSKSNAMSSILLSAVFTFLSSAAHADTRVIQLSPGQSALVGGVQVSGQPGSTDGVQITCGSNQPQIYVGISTFMRDYSCRVNSGNPDFQNALQTAKRSGLQQCTIASGNAPQRCAEQGYEVVGSDESFRGVHPCTINFKFILI